MKGIDPDISREGFVVQGTGSRPLDTIEEKLHSLKAFSKYSGNGMLKHNSLWDAFIIKACYEKLMSMSK
jgi:CobQ-like glutamine amidotransferase family enzyme